MTNQSKIFNLNNEQIEELKLEILSLPENEAIEYLIEILDNDYILSENNEVVEKAENFLSDKRFNKYREIIYNDNIDDDFPYEKEIVYKAINKYKKPDGWSDLGLIGSYLKKNKVDYYKYCGLSDFLELFQDVEVNIDNKTGIRKCKIK